MRTPDEPKMIGLLVVGWALILSASAFARAQEPPLSFHMSFDTEEYLRHDYSARMAWLEDLTPEKRNLELVPGRFGKALLNRNVFVREDFEQTHMSVRDLDTLLEVVCHYRYPYWKDGLRVWGMEPYVWGTGKIKTDGGTLAFWAKGARTYPGDLFFLSSSSFGRQEQYLLAIELKEDKRLEAYIRDARYVTHLIATKPGLWDETKMNHVALVWDRSQGLQLFLNGEVVASNWGRDAWWTTQIPGLFHMPMCGFLYDELWVFDRPASRGEVRSLMTANEPLKGRAEALDDGAAGRLMKAFIGSAERLDLPAVGPTGGETLAVFREIYPRRAGDGIMNAPYVMDGTCQLAWPQDYMSFTNILGDSDFHPEKVDIDLDGKSQVNYVVLEGNLTGGRLLAGENAGDREMKELFSVPNLGQHFFGARIEPTHAKVFRIPFVRGHGSPPPFKEGLALPLTGEIRIHEAGFFNVSAAKAGDLAAPSDVLMIGAALPPPDDGRYGYALRALNDGRNSGLRELAPAGSNRNGPSARIKLNRFERLNLLSGPLKSRALKGLDLDLKLRNARDGEFLIVRFHDPGVPARIWTQVVFGLEGFDGRPGRLRLRLDPVDIRMAADDRVWLEIMSSGDVEMEVLGREGSSIGLVTAPLEEAEPAYSRKALQPALGSYSKIYNWYYPWLLTGEKPAAESPVTFGGYYDIVTYPLAVLRTSPDDFMANTLVDLSLVRYGIDLKAFNDHWMDSNWHPDPEKYQSNKPRSFYTWEQSTDYWPPMTLKKGDDSPDWAFYERHYLQGLQKIVHWYADRQNLDGQIGGGWNDDVLCCQKVTGPLLYMGDRKARRLFDRVFEGIDATKMFVDGYCTIVPIDGIHARDLVRSRYERFLFELGSPDKALFSLRTGWRWKKPEQTPVNYFDGSTFKYDYDLMLWYWGLAPGLPEFAAKKEDVTEMFRKYAPAVNDVLYFRYTDANMFNDATYLPGAAEIKKAIVGGEAGPFTRSELIDSLSISASWEAGGGPSIPKWIERASDEAFLAHLYSYDEVEQDVAVRLFRLKRGVYRISLIYEGKDAGLGTAFSETKTLSRFSKVTVRVRPGREFALSVERIEELPDPGPLADLAVRGLERTANAVTADVLNIGAAAAADVTVRLEDGSGRTLGEKRIERLKSARDFVPGKERVSFVLPDGVPGAVRIVADPGNRIDEITEENNSISLGTES